MRKKAKYLHDAPNDALMPGIAGSHFQYVNNAQQHPQAMPNQTYPGSTIGNVYGQQQGVPSSFSVYPSNGNQGHVPPSLQQTVIPPQTYSNQQSPIATQFNTASTQGPSSIQNMSDVIQPSISANQSSTIQRSFGGNGLFDPNDTAQYNFDPASFNFGNHYGALEFGMLGHMSSGAAETPPQDASAQFSQSNGGSYTTPNTISTSYNDSPVGTQPYIFPHDQSTNEWNNGARPNLLQNGGSNVFNMGNQGQDSMKQEFPNGFTIGAANSNLNSPNSTSSGPLIPGFDDSPTATTLYTSNYSSNSSRPSTQDRANQQQIQQQQLQQQQQQQQHSQAPKPPSILSTPNLKAQTVPTRRVRDPSTIYESVKQPYSYTTGFHGLTAFLQRRFSPSKTLRIAKALASIRPSFISCTKALNRDDLIFMEKCFQRTLWEYEDFINACGTPTIVCRRTGEVAAVGKEFSILTGWKKDVLLGREANLNVNTGGEGGNLSGQPTGTGTGASTSSARGGGLNTPRVPEGMRSDMLDPSRPQPVFLAELLDDDSVIQFYEDFARLAFGDSRGSVTTQCKLLRYQTKEGTGMGAKLERDDEGVLEIKKKQLGNAKLKERENQRSRNEIRGEAGIDKLGEDGKVTCSYCWTVKRDVFDIPMLIVMNVSCSLTWSPLYQEKEKERESEKSNAC